MSKKTIRFKMPKTKAPRRDETPDVAAAPFEELSPTASRRETSASEIVIASEPDRWVKDRDLNAGVALEPAAVASPAVRSSAKPSLTIDLAGERNFAQVITLSFLAPPLLCWFWGANAVMRTWGNLAVSRRVPM
jgi:hypothetical protein